MNTATLNPHNEYELLALYCNLRSKHNLEPIDMKDPPKDPEHPIAIEIMRIVNAAKGGKDFTWKNVHLMIRQAEADAEDGW